MQTKTKLSFISLIFLISFASVNAVLFTPALPAISNFFDISSGVAQQTITWFLIGYTAGQLIYGPLANRYGRKAALFGGITLEIISSLFCVIAGYFHLYPLLVIGRFLMALGSGAGLKITFTLINETNDAISASRLLSYLMIAFAITPGISVLLGGMLSSHFGWESTFYASAVYGIIVLILAMRLPETKTTLDYKALSIKRLATGYAEQFKNKQLISAGLLMGAGTSIVYIFATLAPFIAITHLHMNSISYGQANLLPPIGLLIGSLLSAQLTKFIRQTLIIRLGVLLSLSGSILMLALLMMQLTPLVSLFIPMILCYAGLGFINANASSLAMNNVDDKANASAVLNFTNMGFTTITVLCLGTINITPLLLPCVYIVISLFMISIMRRVVRG